MVLSKSELKSWYYDKAANSENRMAELMLWAEEHDLLTKVTEAVAEGKFCNWVINPTYEELVFLISEM